MKPSLGPGAEFDLIRRFVDRTGPLGEDVVVGPGDDAAVLAAGNIVVSSDMSVEGVHFRRDWVDLEEAGCRAASAALSDLAAMAARPVGVVASLAVPRADVPDGAERVMAGVVRAIERVGAALIGGDLTRTTGPIVLDVAVLGTAERPVLRTGARPGDELWVTGELGGAAAALASWSAGRKPSKAARVAYVAARPRTREALWLVERVPLSAMIDLSDGLAGDAAHLAAASKVGILLWPASVPVHPAAREIAVDEEAALDLALGGGEDYELCFTAPPGSMAAAREEFEEMFGVMLRQVGTVREGEGVRLLRKDGKEMAPPVSGYRHFQDGEG